jgi:hypothetical protein
MQVRLIILDDKGEEVEVRDGGSRVDSGRHVTLSTGGGVSVTVSASDLRKALNAITRRAEEA